MKFISLWAHALFAAVLLRWGRGLPTKPGERVPCVGGCGTKIGYTPPHPLDEQICGTCDRLAKEAAGLIPITVKCSLCPRRTLYTPPYHKDEHLCDLCHDEIAELRAEGGLD